MENYSVGEDTEKLDPLTFLVRYKMLQLLWKTAWRFFKKLNTEFQRSQEFHSSVYSSNTESQCSSIYTAVYSSALQESKTV